jgi:aminoglycoside 2''-phosphotransferase
MDVHQRYIAEIREIAPDLIIHQVELNRDGLVNDVLVVNQQRVFQFPKNEQAKMALRHEARVLTLARQFVKVSLPRFALHQNDAVSYEFIPGEALLREDILRQDTIIQDALAETLAEFLQQIHNIPASSLDEADIRLSGAVRTADDWLRIY